MRLVLRMAVAIALATLLTLLVARLLLDSPADSVSLRALAGHARLEAQQIAAAPAAERHGKAQELGNLLGYPAELEPATPSADGALAAPRAEWRAGKLFVIAAVPDTYGQLVLGPLPFGRVASLPAVVVLALSVAAAGAFITARPLLRRLRAHEGVASRMCAGDFTARAARDDGDALDGIGAALNKLGDRIGQLLSDERDLLRTVAHEVRAPIARMRFRIERLHQLASDDAKKHSSGLIADLLQVDNLFEELLTYVAFDEFDHERPELQLQAIAVRETTERVVAEVTATDESVTVEVSGGQEACVLGNPKLFERALTNLLLNAIAYGGPKIRVEIREFNQECVLDVQDSGPGIPELDRPKVIKPFVRLSTKKTRGTGLGLAIVDRIMRLHQGRLHIVAAPNGGASIQLVFKNKNPKPRARWSLNALSLPGAKARGL